MAEKRMFTKKVTDSDSFIELSSSAQALYFHLNQAADDDGFNNQVQNAMFKAHATIDDLKVLMMKNFIIRFESGVIVIKHWRMHNTLRKDRYTPTNFQEELAMLGLKDNGSYTLNLKRLPDGCQMVAKRLPNGCHSIDKVRLEKNSIDNTCALEMHDEESIDSFFESVWKLYPIKRGKGQVSKTKKKVLQKVGYEQLSRCVDRFLEDMNSSGRDKQYWMQGSTFFNSGYVDYLDENYGSKTDTCLEVPEKEEAAMPYDLISDEEYEEFKDFCRSNNCSLNIDGWNKYKKAVKNG